MDHRLPIVPRGSSRWRRRIDGRAWVPGSPLRWTVSRRPPAFAGWKPKPWSGISPRRCHCYRNAASRSWNGTKPRASVQRRSISADSTSCEAGSGALDRHRLRGIGRVLKMLVTRWATRHGISVVHTDNRADNAGMLAINRELGFQPDEVVVIMEKTLATPAAI